MQCFLTSMPEPSTSDLIHMQKFYDSPESGPMLLPGADSRLFGTSGNLETDIAPDLVALQARHNETKFSRWMIKQVSLRCGGILKPESVAGTNMFGVKDEKLVRIVDWLNSVLASLLPVLSIVCLYYVKSMGARLALIVAFNVVFTLCLRAFGQPKRTELFAVVAA
jgi:hypothetical protein